MAREAVGDYYTEQALSFFRHAAGFGVEELGPNLVALNPFV